MQAAGHLNRWILPYLLHANEISTQGDCMLFRQVMRR